MAHLLPYSHGTAEEFRQVAGRLPSEMRVCANCHETCAKTVIDTNVEGSEVTAPVALVCSKPQCTTALRYNMQQDMALLRNNACAEVHQNIDVESLARVATGSSLGGKQRIAAQLETFGRDAKWGMSPDDSMPAGEALDGATNTSVASSMPVSEPIDAYLVGQAKVGAPVDIQRTTKLLTSVSAFLQDGAGKEFSDLYKKVIAEKKWGNIDVSLNNRTLFMPPVLIVVPTSIPAGVAYSTEQAAEFIKGLYRLMMRIPFHLRLAFTSALNYSFTAANDEVVRLYSTDAKKLMVEFSGKTVSQSSGLLLGTKFEVVKMVTLVNGTALLFENKAPAAAAAVEPPLTLGSVATAAVGV